MERVQFQQEQMLDELKDLVEKNLFTKSETKEIMKRRTLFETALVRRVAKKADFLRYASYEMGLEQLRRKRIARLKLPAGPASISDYALVRRQFHIFERALKKFKADVGLWIQYIDVAKREGANTLVSRVTARALQLHPDTPALYIVAAAHELEHGSPSAARTLLQRGIRINAESVEMWREYVRMELGFMESLRRRWDVLGLAEKGKGKEAGVGEGAGLAEAGAGAGLAAAEGLAGDDAGDGRQAILHGAIVQAVIASAVKALDTIDLFDALIRLVHEFPLADALRRVLLDQLYALLQAAHPANPRAARMLAECVLHKRLAGEALVDAVQQANEQMLALAGDAYQVFAETVCAGIIDDDLKLYLLLCVRACQSDGAAQ